MHQYTMHNTCQVWHYEQAIDFTQNTYFMIQISFGPKDPLFQQARTYSCSNDIDTIDFFFDTSDFVFKDIYNEAYN